MPKKYIKVKNRIAPRVPDSSSSTGSTEADRERAPMANPSEGTAPPPKRTTPADNPTVQAPSLPEATAPKVAQVPPSGNGATPGNSPEEREPENPRASVQPTNASRDGGASPIPNLLEEHPPTSGGSSPVDVTSQQKVPELQGIPPPGHLQQGTLMYGPGGLPRVLNKPGIYHSTEDSTAAHVLSDGRVVWFDRRLKYPGVPGAPYPMHHQHIQRQHQANGHQQMHRAPGPPVFPPHRAPGVPGGSHARAPTPLHVATGQPLVPGHPQFYGQRPPPGHPDPRFQGHPNAMHYAMSITPPNGQAQHPHPQGHPLPHQSHLVQYVPIRPEQMHQRVPDPRAPRMSLPGTPIAQTPPPAQRSSSTVPPANVTAPGQAADRMPPSTPNKDLSEQADNDTQRRRRHRTENQHERPASVIEVEMPAATPNPLPSESTEKVELSSPPPPIFHKTPTPHDGDSKTSGFPVDTLNPHFILEYCKNEMQTLRLEKDAELQRRMTEMEQEHKKEIDLMKARYSAILTEKDNMIDTLRKYNREFDHVSNDKTHENIYLKNRVRELESEKLATKTLVESLEEQRLRAQLKDQALTTEINKLQSERWRQDDERENGVHRIQQTDETLKSDYEEALKTIDSLQSELEKVIDDRNAVKEKLALKEEQFKAYKKAKTDGKDDNQLRKENINLKAFVVRARKTVKQLAEGEEEEDLNLEKLLDEARVEEFFAWLRIASYSKAAKEFMATLIMKQKEMVENFRVAWNDAMKMAVDIGKMGNDVKFETIKQMVDVLVKLFSDTKEVYQRFAATSNTIGRKRKVQDSYAERLTLDLKRMRYSK